MAMPAPRPATEEDRKYQLLQVQLADLARQDLRPAIAKATELLLEAGTAQRAIEAPLPFSLGQRRFEIVHRGSFTPTGPGSAAIEHFEVHRLSDGSVIAGLVRKQILRLGHDGEQHGWLYEALFYSGLAAELQMPVVVIPRLFGGMVEPGAITMIIEYLPAATRPLVLPWYQQTAMAIGKLGAVTSLKELQHTEWLTPYRLGMTTSTLDSLEALAVRCLADARESGPQSAACQTTRRIRFVARCCSRLPVRRPRRYALSRQRPCRSRPPVQPGTSQLRPNPASLRGLLPAKAAIDPTRFEQHA